MNQKDFETDTNEEFKSPLILSPRYSLKQLDILQESLGFNHRTLKPHFQSYLTLQQQSSKNYGIIDTQSNTIASPNHNDLTIKQLKSGQVKLMDTINIYFEQSLDDFLSNDDLEYNQNISNVKRKQTLDKFKPLRNNEKANSNYKTSLKCYHTNSYQVQKLKNTKQSKPKQFHYKNYNSSSDFDDNEKNLAIQNIQETDEEINKLGNKFVRNNSNGKMLLISTLEI
eukprot:403372223